MTSHQIAHLTLEVGTVSFLVSLLHTIMRMRTASVIELAVNACAYVHSDKRFTLTRILIDIKYNLLSLTV